MQKSPQLIFLLLSIHGVFIICHSTPAQADTPPREGRASWYSVECCRTNPEPHCPMANGQSLYEAEAKGELFAASWHYPLGTWLRVTNKTNGRAVIVRITDRGPAKRLNRVIDLSKKAFERLSDSRAGIISVSVERVGGAA